MEEAKKTITRITWTSDTAANWASVNPILAEGENALETDTRKHKVGNGISRYNALSYDSPEVSQEFGNDLILAVSQKTLSQRFAKLDNYSQTFKDQERLI